jgi:protein-S-isoprenylcysteine O-methyltransferase Ste14
MSNNTWLHNSRGEWYVIAQAVLLFALLFAPTLDGHIGGQVATIVSSPLFVVGLGFIVLGTVGLGGRNVSPFPKPKEDASLVESGIFSVVRHPIYSGFIFFSFGWSILWHSLAALIAALVLLVFFDIKARREERWLEAKFSAYTAYKERVKKLIPFVY